MTASPTSKTSFCAAINPSSNWIDRTIATLLLYATGKALLLGEETLMRYGRELLKGSTDSLLLCLISQQPMYGYQIIQELEARSQGYFKFKEGTLYPALHRLEKQGLIRGKWERVASGQERKYYHITDKGIGVLSDKIFEWRSFSTAIDLIMQPRVV
jgi:DNA-binding PadR family transcriptional regulator